MTNLMNSHSSQPSSPEFELEPDTPPTSPVEWQESTDGNVQKLAVHIPEARQRHSDPAQSRGYPRPSAAGSSPKSPPTRISSFRLRFGSRKRKRSSDSEVLKLKSTASAPAQLSADATTTLPEDPVRGGGGFSRAHAQEARQNLNAIFDAAEAVSRRINALVDAYAQRRKSQLVITPVPLFAAWREVQCPRCQIEELKSPAKTRPWTMRGIEIRGDSDGKSGACRKNSRERNSTGSDGDDEDSDSEPLLAKRRRKPMEPGSITGEVAYEIVTQQPRQFRRGEVITRVEMTRAGEYERISVKPKRRRQGKQAEHDPWQTEFCECPILPAAEIFAPCPNMARFCEYCPTPKCEATKYRPPQLPSSGYFRNPLVCKNGTSSIPCGISCRPSADTDLYHVTNSHLELRHTIERTIKRSGISSQRNLLKLAELWGLGGGITESFDDLKKTIAYWRDLEQVKKDWAWVIARHHPENWAEARELCRLEVEKAREPTDESIMDDCGAWFFLLGPKMQRLDEALVREEEARLNWDVFHRIQQLHRQQEVDVERDWRKEKKKQGWKNILTPTKTKRLSVKDVSTWAWGVVTTLLKMRGERLDKLKPEDGLTVDTDWE